ncbi:hypothetical protein BDQ12DRAFT_669477 [Crucibulum laeve]|uniref:Uncharacterized protein n=1 Tax=Crucibulum laeve TaxID=68775 RepID=A0A5C3LQ36_9AGAR|nr:hypothetical protein BDQ12DRAFT_669477 [Crucibulum laeve]
MSVSSIFNLTSIAFRIFVGAGYVELSSPASGSVQAHHANDAVPWYHMARPIFIRCGSDEYSNCHGSARTTSSPFLISIYTESRITSLTTTQNNGNNTPIPWNRKRERVGENRHGSRHLDNKAYTPLKMSKRVYYDYGLLIKYGSFKFVGTTVYNDI